MTPEPSKDQSYCDVGQHAPVCSGYTEDEADPESCFCTCHDEVLAVHVDKKGRVMTHNHITRDIKRPGDCPGCDQYWKKAGVIP